MLDDRRLLWNERGIDGDGLFDGRVLENLGCNAGIGGRDAGRRAELDRLELREVDVRQVDRRLMRDLGANWRGEIRWGASTIGAAG